MDGTRFIYKSCGALPALVQECADRLAALALLMGRFGTGVCVCVCACVRLCVCVGGAGGCCEWWRRSWGCSSVNSSSATAVFAVPASPVLIPLHSSSFQEGIGIKFRRRLGMHSAPSTCTSVQNNPYGFDSTVGEGIGWRGEGDWDGGVVARKRMNSWVNSCTDSKWSIHCLVGGLNR